MSTSFFEAELFEAALLSKPSFIFLLDGYEPEEKLANLLKLLQPDAALVDYRRVAELRKDESDPKYGEALSELGYAMLTTGEKIRGVSYMEEGFELLKSVHSSGFLIRAMRKLAIGYARCWKIGAALDLAVEAHDLALSIGAHDQIHPLQKLAKKLRFRL